MYEKIREILLNTERPARYTGGEYNLPDMDKKCSSRVCICFPEMYEVGMSNIGIRILYHMLNDTDDIVCERCFAPAQDMANLLQENKVDLFSIDTKRPLKSFDIVGFSIGYEMLYTNILYMLELANIPFYRKDRGDDYPVLVAGGPSVVNPLPFSDYFDAILIGEGEKCLLEFTLLYNEYKNKNLSKQEFLKNASKLDGVFVPEYTPKDAQNDMFCENSVKRAVVDDFENAYFPTKILVPNIEIVHDRAVLELFRGCANGCRFCQACFYYRPMRFRSASKLREQARALIDATGYDELSLASLSTGDYRELGELASGLKCEFSGENIKLSLPSLRLDSYNDTISEDTRRNSITFAPEAGTQRLRNVINKNVSDENIERSILSAIKLGIKNIKLYFMVGLPTETAEDLQGIVDLVYKIKKLYWENSPTPKALQITLSTAVFIPKPLTPFQWERQISYDEMIEKQNFLKDNLRIKGVRYNWHDAKTAVIESVLARGDERLAKVIERAYRLGCKFDGWSEFFNYEKWEQAFADCGVDMADYTREFAEDEMLAWDFVDNGVSKKYLLREKKKAYIGELTPSCNLQCTGCGANALGRCFE